MRNITEIRFSDTTGNGKFSGKPDLPVEIFFPDAARSEKRGRESAHLGIGVALVECVGRRPSVPEHPRARRHPADVFRGGGYRK